MKELKINWLIKLGLKFSPNLAMRFLSKNSGANWPLLNKLHNLFGQIKRIDIIPTTAGRGFILILDKKMSLHFYQDHDHFYYDGFEMGEYDGGDVTIFDNLNSPISNSRE